MLRIGLRKRKSKDPKGLKSFAGESTVTLFGVTKDGGVVSQPRHADRSESRDKQKHLPSASLHAQSVFYCQSLSFPYLPSS
jgi:hypothetical protein